MPLSTKRWAVICLLGGLAGCGSSGDGTASPGPAAPSGSAADSGVGRPTSDAAAQAPPAEGLPAPEPAAVNTWLQSKSYRAWRHESAPHPSTGPHGGSVQTYLNASLDASLGAGQAEHPSGAVSVKEFFEGGQLAGWAFMMKTQSASDGGKGWYWYEVFDVQPGAAPIEGQGIRSCTTCHGQGTDYVRVPYPLQ